MRRSAGGGSLRTGSQLRPACCTGTPRARGTLTAARPPAGSSTGSARTKPGWCRPSGKPKPKSVLYFVGLARRAGASLRLRSFTGEAVAPPGTGAQPALEQPLPSAGRGKAGSSGEGFCGRDRQPCPPRRARRRPGGGAAAPPPAPARQKRRRRRSGPAPARRGCLSPRSASGAPPSAFPAPGARRPCAPFPGGQPLGGREPLRGGQPL